MRFPLHSILISHTHTSLMLSVSLLLCMPVAQHKDLTDFYAVLSDHIAQTEAKDNQKQKDEYNNL